MVNWYFKFIAHRNLHVEINGNLVTKTVCKGFPQGGVCSAKFCIIAFNEAIEIINSYGAFGNGFADDCVTMISGKNLKAMMNNLQKVVNKLEAWGQTAGLKFNSSKTEVVIFTKKRLKPEHMPQKLKVSNQPVEFSTTAKYLGVTLDQKLTWNTHLHNQINKGKRYLFTLKKAVVRNWGPKPKFIKWMIDAVFIKRFTYGILVWGHTLRNPSKKAAVSKLNKLAASLITPVRTSTPLEGLQVIHNMMPIHLLAMYESLASLKRSSHAIELDWLGYSPTRKTYILLATKTNRTTA